MSHQRASWSGSLAFILAAAASAIGLGNLWRFPYLAAKYGGGAFIFTYLALSLTLGFVMLITEIAIGRKTRQSQITAFSQLGGKRWGWVGFLSTLVPFLIAPYYAVVGGWVVKYFVKYALELLLGARTLLEPPEVFANFVAAPNEPFVYMLIFIVLTIAVILVGVKNGIEKANLVLMPTLFLMAIGIAIWVALQPGALDGIKYYLVPDFSQVDNLGKVILGAMGQMFFSLSIAMGIMVTYGSYMRKDGSIPRSAVRIAFADTGIAILAGFMVIPVVYMFAVKSGLDVSSAMKAGPGMMFISLPQIFLTFGKMGSLIGFVFFTLALFAALTSAISMSEACVAAICDYGKVSRKVSAISFGLFCVVCGAFSAFSYGRLAGVQPFGMPILDFIDSVVNSAIMPITAIGICLFVGYGVGPAKIMFEVKNGHGKATFSRVYAFAMRYVVPVLIAAILVSELCRTFGIGGWTI